jgi:hypothetical protein
LQARFELKVLSYTNEKIEARLPIAVIGYYNVLVFRNGFGN